MTYEEWIKNKLEAALEIYKRTETEIPEESEEQLSDFANYLERITNNQPSVNVSAIEEMIDRYAKEYQKFENNEDEDKPVTDAGVMRDFCFYINWRLDR